MKTLKLAVPLLIVLLFFTSCQRYYTDIAIKNAYASYNYLYDTTLSLKKIDIETAESVEIQLIIQAVNYALGDFRIQELATHSGNEDHDATGSNYSECFAVIEKLCFLAQQEDYIDKWNEAINEFIVALDKYKITYDGIVNAYNSRDYGGSHYYVFVH